MHNRITHNERKNDEKKLGTIFIVDISDELKNEQNKTKQKKRKTEIARI